MTRWLAFAPRRRHALLRRTPAVASDRLTRVGTSTLNQGPVYEGPNVFIAPPVYFESGFADEMPYPSVQFYTLGHGQHFYQAVSWHHRRHAQRSRSYPAYSTD